MIKITDPAKQKRVMGGKVILDRASIVVFGMDIRENRPGSPSLRCDIAYGVESECGAFEAFSFESIASTVAHYKDHPVWHGCVHGEHDPGEIAKGSDLMHELQMWFEGVLVAEGMFGEGAEVVLYRCAHLTVPANEGDVK